MLHPPQEQAAKTDMLSVHKYPSILVLRTVEEGVANARI